MMVNPQDLQNFLKHSQPPTPELEEHHRRLKYRMDRFRVKLVGTDEIMDVTQKYGRPSIVRADSDGVTIAHFPPDLADVDATDDKSEHRWEEQGSATTYPWNQVEFIDHQWWIDEAAAKVEIDPNRPSPYL